MTRPVTVTDHAVTRFIERHAPNLPIGSARKVLMGLIEIAEHVETVSDESQEIWRITWRTSHLDMLIVVRSRDGAVTTVLPTVMP